MSDNEKSTQTEEPNFRYNAALAQDIENKWQKIWDEQGTFWAANVNGDLKDGKGRNAEGRTAYFAMDMFPYPSGKGLHVGHPLGYLASDVVSRYHRMKGENVLHAMGYDAFGLPAEQYAVQTGQHPRVTTEANIANMSRQLHRMGLSFDNRRTFATIDPRLRALDPMDLLAQSTIPGTTRTPPTRPAPRAPHARSPSSWPSSNPAKRPFRATSPMASSGPTSLTPSSRIS